MRFLSLSLRTFVLYSLSVKGCQFCLKVVFNVLLPKVDLILTNEDGKYFCCLIENVINEIRQDQEKIEVIEKSEVIDKSDDVKEKELSKQSINDKTVNDHLLKPSSINTEKPRFPVKNMDPLTNKSDKIKEKEVNEQSLHDKTVNDHLLQSSSINTEKPRFSVKNMDPLIKRFPVKEGNSSKSDYKNEETCESTLQARLKNDQKSLKALELKMNKLRMEAAKPEETKPKTNFCFREDRPWH
ncbi:hypothetical protein NBO_378g0015 [Nosema bombycis CQ1]|uniref:Uncharacterized protein n=1 Tax=Nosema bombycis (strain CQ1 / CVCC 102059) TaxID=578461 RepID=R0MEZ4_NOSB1|nr:hypothetical protein NBO_378g0015 [Nosema bombycis CQ1]|eukprot:EOB12705.1 hypothetical protein NBO_378g0015 [Nosema bombycis CQ1]